MPSQMPLQHPPGFKKLHGLPECRHDATCARVGALTLSTTGTAAAAPRPSVPCHLLTNVRRIGSGSALTVLNLSMVRRY
jgi:hypothetical protein